MEPLLERLSCKDRLDVSDASDLLQFLQSQAEPLLSQHTSPAPPTAATRTTAAVDRSSPLVEGAVSTNRPAVPVIGGVVTRQHPPHSSDSSMRGLHTPALQSRDRERRRDVATPPGPSPSPGRRDHSAGGEETRLDISSWSEFPPMVQNDKTPQRSSKSSERNKSKSSAAKKPSRRITLTPLPSQPPPPPSLFLPSPNSSGGNNGWKSNPAFTNHSPASEATPPSLSEERRLLKEERSRRRQKHGSRTAPPLQRDSGTHKPSTTTCGAAGRDKRSMSAQRGQQVKGQSTARHRGRNSEENGIDLKISSHSIFELNHGTECYSKKSNLSNALSSRMDPLCNAVSGQRSISTLTSAGATASRAPLTSTPMPSKGCGQNLPSHVSSSSVTHQDALDLLSSHYATLITGHMLPNLTSEVHFILQLLTANAPHSPKHTSDHGQSSNLFESVDNCVYFAVTVLEKIKHLLECLDRSTLQLLAENPRVAEFNSDLSLYFAEACSNSSSVSGSYPGFPPPLDSTHSSLAKGRGFGVPFQEATDNSKNFPSMKAFHAFKKQRDLFYLILREWEENQHTPNWSMRTALADKIQVLIQQHGEVCSLAHFARLFQRQLVESCRYPLHYRLSPSSQGGGGGGGVERELGPGGGGLMGQLGKTDPQRLMRLTERFFLPSSSVVGGPRPPPSFSPMEEFFTDFILTADSYVFNHHLKTTICTELIKFHSGCVSLHRNDVADTILTMRSLAKFLGFLHFLPYRKPTPDSAILARNMMPEPLPLVQCVMESCDYGHLCVTVPWVVSFLSMMDGHAHKLTSISTLITTLIDVYRSVSLREGLSGRTRLTIATTLGWLFESPEFPSSVFFDHLKSHPSPSLSITPPAQGGLDLQDVVSVELLYACCNYLGEFRCLLAEFAAGLQPKASPMRKITPISTDIDRENTNPQKQLQVQLRENFFRSHPAYLKQLCDVTAERVSASATAQCEGELLPQAIAGGVRKLTKWFREKCSLVGVASEAVGVAFEGTNHKEFFTQAEAERKIFQVVFETSQTASEKFERFIATFCPQQASKALEALLTETLSDQVVQTASEIAGDCAKERCCKWSTEKLRGIVHEGLTRVFEKTKRAVKAAMKSKDTQTNSTLPLSFPDQNQQRQRFDLIGQFASSISTKVAAQSAEIDLDSSIGRVKEVVERSLSKDNSQVLSELQESLSEFCSDIYLSAFVTPNLPVPQAIPIGSGVQVLSLSADLAVKLIAEGLLMRQKSVTSGCQVMDSLFNSLLLYWKMMKSLKLDVPIHKLLNNEAFQNYFNTGKPLVWMCLADVIVGVVEEMITSSSVVEGLWMCRTHLLKEEQMRSFCEAAAVFLERWHSQDQDRTQPPRCSTMEVPSNGHTLSLPPSNSLSSLAQTSLSPSPFSLPPSSLSRHSFNKNIHFIRLLSFVLSQQDSRDIPVSLLSHELSNLCTVVRHESRN